MGSWKRLFQPLYCPSADWQSISGALLPGSIPGNGRQSPFNPGDPSHNATSHVAGVSLGRSTDLKAEFVLPFWGRPSQQPACKVCQFVWVQSLRHSKNRIDGDWDTDMHIHGCWFLDSGGQLDATCNLVDFPNPPGLHPNLYIGFGSGQSSRKPELTSKLSIVESSAL